jgi:hypothetical protein
MAQNNSEALKLAKQLVTILSKGADTAAKMPAPDAIEDMDKAQIAEVAEAFGISTDGKKAAAIKALVTTAANIVAGETDELEKDEVTELCEAVGVAPSKKLDATVEALSEYFDSTKDSEDGDESSDEDGDDEDEDSDEDDEDEKPKGKKSKKSDDEDEDEDSDDDDDSDDDKDSDDDDKDEDEDEDSDDDDDDDDKPAKGKKSKKSDDDDEDSDSDDDDGEDSDDDDDDDAESDDEVDEKEQAKRVKAYNKAAKKPVKNYAALVKLMTDEEGEAAEWAEPYVKGEEAFCCGLPLKAVKEGKKKFGVCQVTGKKFEQDEDGALVEVEEDGDDE